ncbi:MAG: NusA-like transcription termination signal-binding factor [Thermoplasmatota archaeon]
MVEIVLDTETLRLITLFERVTGARVKDVLEEPDRVAFVVEEKDIGKAIGKGAVHLKRLREILGREVDVFAFNAEPQAFVRNLMHRYKPEEVRLEERGDGTKVAHVRLPATERGRAIGRGGRNIQLARKLAARHHSLGDISLDG